MATYSELKLVSEDSTFRDRIHVACVVAADQIRLEPTSTPSHDARLTWARKALDNARGEIVNQMVLIVLAQNRAATLTQITGATDAQIQSAVDGAVNLFAV